MIEMAMMLAHFLRVALPVAIAGTFGLRCAHADIYTWVDASGSMNVSNLAPPDGVRVVKVLHTSESATAREEATRAAARQAETQALAERVRQLEDEIELAKRQAPPAAYAPMPPPLVVQYIVAPAPPPVQYVVSESWSATNACDPASLNCAFAWFPNFYPTSVVVLRTPSFRHTRPAFGGHNFHTHPPLVQSRAMPRVAPLGPSERFHRG